MTLGLARKYRPRRFAEVVGQQHITDALRTGIQKGRIGQAYLFHGPRGTGKTTCARIMARVLNCEQPQNGEPCLSCASCRAFEEGRSVNIYELDAASNSSVEDIRTLIDQVQYPPSSGKYKVYIIDEVHMLSQSAFNAFLKTLEEPPSHAVFILATTEKHRILPTILSRCQVFDFRRLPLERIVARLREILDKEGVDATDEALYAIAGQADGIMRDALTITDRIIGGIEDALTEEKVYHLLGIPPVQRFFELWKHIMAQDVAGALAQVAALLHDGYDEAMLFQGLRWHIRNLLLAARADTRPLIQQAPAVVTAYQQQADGLDPLYLTNALHITAEMEGRLGRSAVPRLHLETAILKLIYLQEIVQPVPTAEPHPKKEPKHTAVSVPPKRPAPPPAETRPAPPSETPPKIEAPEKTPAEAKTTSKPSVPDTEQPYWKQLWEGFVGEASPSLKKILSKVEPHFQEPDTVVIQVPPGYKSVVEKARQQYMLRHARRKYQWNVEEEARLSPEQQLEALKSKNPAFGRLAEGLGLFPAD